MPASYTIRRSVPRNTRRSKPASTPSTCFPSFSINLFMAFPLPRGDLSSNTTNIIREQETPSPFGCGYAALCKLDPPELRPVDAFDSVVPGQPIVQEREPRVQKIRQRTIFPQHRFEEHARLGPHRFPQLRPPLGKFL